MTFVIITSTETKHAGEMDNCITVASTQSIIAGSTPKTSSKDRSSISASSNGGGGPGEGGEW
jgi:hypothetical protein